MGMACVVLLPLLLVVVIAVVVPCSDPFVNVTIHMVMLMVQLRRLHEPKQCRGLDWRCGGRRPRRHLWRRRHSAHAPPPSAGHGQRVRDAAPHCTARHNPRGARLTDLKTHPSLQAS